MSEENNDQTSSSSPPPAVMAAGDGASATALPPESQRERWMKYGANVALTCIVVILLAGLCIWAARGSNKYTRALHARPDLTGDASNQLRPQTVEIIRSLPRKVTL